ncbi:MAG: DUF4258 domain-containing protein [Acidobacteriales bacterium]|nr:DUF4258 domain-containing protein [Terriglobales bacterium]
MGIRRIRRAVREDRYQFSVHALEEMDDDNLAEEDIRRVILHGVVAAELVDDPRGVRFVVRGKPVGDDCDVEVVCRFLPSGLLRIITVYMLED